MVKIFTIKSFTNFTNIVVKLSIKTIGVLQFRIIICAVFLMIFSTDCRTTKSTKSTKAAAEFYTSYSKKLGVILDGTEDKKFIEAISGWIGTPYVYGGVSKKGTDCSGMVQTIFKELYGISLNRTAYDQVDDCSFVTKRNLQSRDLIFFKINSKKISHVGIYIANNKFIQASLNGVMISDLTDAYYSKYYYSGGRIKKLQ